jgi:hypothetical protein
MKSPPGKRRRHHEQGRRGRGQRQWLWPRRIVTGALVVVFGHDSAGKTPLACWIAAQVTRRGGCWPFGEGPAPHGYVLYLPSEEEHEEAVRRVVAMGGDDGLVLRLPDRDAEGRWFKLDETGIARLDDFLTRWCNVKLIVFDVLKSFLPSESHVEGKMREILDPLIRCVRKHDCALLCVMHRRKNPAALRAVDTIAGSKAFAAMARGAMLVHRTQDAETGEERFFILPAKDSYRRTPTPPPALEFKIVSAQIADDAGNPVDTIGLQWVGQSELTCDRVLELEHQRMRGSVRPVAAAEEWLLEHLADGPKASGDVRKAGLDQGIPERTLYRGFDLLKADGRAEAKAGTWRLKDKPSHLKLVVSNDPEDPGPKGLEPKPPTEPEPPKPPTKPEPEPA